MKYRFAAAGLLLFWGAAPALGEDFHPEPLWLGGVADEPLIAVDDSTLTLSPLEGRLALDFVSHDGESQKTIFAYVSDKLGTVTDDDSGGKVNGFFRLTDVGLDIQYDDGRTASLFANVANGLTMTRRGSDGGTVCVSWYPKDHVFSEAERRAAVAAYAQSLGISQAAPPTTPAPTKKRKAHLARVEPVGNICSPAMRAPQRAAANPPVVAAAASAAPPQAASASVQASTIVSAGSGASQCLGLEVQGSFIGFRNRCSNDVQVTYCLEKSVDPTLACGSATKAGSIAANGFTGVLADSTAAEHDIRWVACSGGPGEVAAVLDRADPPSGRCVKKTP